ncbi:MAG: hypothetical protein FWH25_03080 [Syntrophorhabdaceae bacterium]|nr:hypothetical protein [Syntrophorhabdaceae bacterium]
MAVIPRIGGNYIQPQPGEQGLRIRFHAIIHPEIPMIHLFSAIPRELYHTPFYGVKQNQNKCREARNALNRSIEQCRDNEK